MSEIVFVDSLGKCYTKRPGRPRENDEVRFWSNVNLEGSVNRWRPELGPCHLWTGTKTRRGYGQFWAEGKTHRAHRYAWEVVYGNEFADLLEHLCNTMLCVREDHLKDSSPGENTRRAIADGLRKPGPYSEEVM